jgi:type I restriction enzyme R subunit
MDLFNPHEKTIVFCATQEHAGMVRDFINQYAVEKGWTTNSNYCVRVTANDGVAGENDLKTFQDNEKTIPTILTTSRKLSTGVDARNVRNIVLMRPCNNMIEFKQIIGRGTRMYDGKDYFTIYDFVKAHYNFADSDWDGEPLEPVTCKTCGNSPCSCEKGDGGETGKCAICGNNPCSCVKPPPPPCTDCGQRPCVCEKMIVLTMSDGTTRRIRHIHSVMYWSPEGKPITAREYVERMYKDLPQFFKDEEQLRQIWSDPTTRDKLLVDLAEVGYDSEKLDSMKDLIDAKDSDVYDVLAYVAYAVETHSRAERIESAKPSIASEFTDAKQQAFIDFILNKYLEEGVSELAATKMKSLLELKYNMISDVILELGSLVVIRETFIGF